MDATAQIGDISKDKKEEFDQLPISDREQAKICHKCESHINDEYILRVGGRSWHPKCLTCELCSAQLTGKCHIRSGKLYCHTDYIKHFGLQCSRCQLYLDNNDLMQRSGGHSYHVSCFHCIVCGQQLNAGDEYYLLEDGSIMCKMDYESGQAAGYDASNKRPRTTINSSQLDALKRAYRESNKPPRHVRERLSLQTGLDMRVVQVWFQNKRAKEKRTHRDHSKGKFSQNGRDSPESECSESIYCEGERMRDEMNGFRHGPTAHSRVAWPIGQGRLVDILDPTQILQQMSTQVDRYNMLY